MHMTDALISPSVGVTFAALSGGAIIYSARKLKEGANERIIPLMAGRRNYYQTKNCSKKTVLKNPSPCNTND